VIHGKNQLFINQGDLTFKEEAAEYGLDFCGFSTQAAFFDYDLDGDLDMYLLNHSVHTARSYGPVSLRLEHDSLAGDRLYRNDLIKGKRFFTNITEHSGIYNSQIGYGLGVNVSDINNDGWPDIYISNDFHETDYLYINNCNGTFTNRFEEYIRHTCRSSMGNDIADFNNDGLLDIMVLDMLPEEEKIRKQSGGEDDEDVYNIKLEYGYGYQFVRNNLQLNLGGGMFSEIGRQSGVYATDWSWAPLFCDVDNDGFKDLFITNGIYRRANDLDYIKFMTKNGFFETEENKNTPDSVLYNKMPLYPNFNYMYRNNGDLTFTNKAKEWGFTTRTYSNGSAYADLDNDGDLDLITNNINDPASIYRNNATAIGKNHFLSVSLKGKDLNSHAVGARVSLYHDGQEQVNEYFPTRGFMSASSGELHFGLGQETEIDSLIVRWPGQSVQVIKDVKADQRIALNAVNADTRLLKTDNNDTHDRLFKKRVLPGLDFRHMEDQFETFKHEQLVPHTMFAEGPAIAAADFNGDGLEDIFAGGAKDQLSVFYMQQSDGSFVEKTSPVFIKDLYCEDVDAAAFDADGDGDNALYIVRGGSEVSLGNPLLNDRLLLNDGHGEFSESDKSLPLAAYNGSCVAPCDYDNDGDIDLFVGTRSVPGAYGLSPRQMLLENDGHGNFSDVTDKRMKRLNKIGMVTDACWMDYDNDGDNDLIIVGEWMKVSVLNNNNGAFTDATSQAGLKETSGWWNCIHACDIDDDGDVDLIGGNLGLNSILKASPAEPVNMYVNDFDSNGTLDQIICQYQDGISYPVASLDELSKQMPGIEKKFQNYSDFGGKTAIEIFGRRAINGGIKKDAVLLASCLFINNGNGTFQIIKLPSEAQVSPVRDIMTADFNKDGKTDIALVGNDYTAKPTYGRQDASYGWILLSGSGHGYKPLMPVASGFRVNGDARKILAAKILGKHFILVGVNNNDLQVFEQLR
jgi:hypothetical protein